VSSQIAITCFGAGKRLRLLIWLLPGLLAVGCLCTYSVLTQKQVPSQAITLVQQFIDNAEISTEKQAVWG